MGGWIEPIVWVIVDAGAVTERVSVTVGTSNCPPPVAQLEMAVASVVTVTAERLTVSVIVGGRPREPQLETTVASVVTVTGGSISVSVIVAGSGSPMVES